jgi:hypothetical protein
MAKKLLHNPLAVVAVPQANVREVEPSGQVLHDLRFVGKVFNSETQEFEVVPGGVVVQYSAHIVAKLKEGALLPANQQTAVAAGVAFSG